MSGPRRVSLISLGCPKNLVDSEGLVSNLMGHDFEVVVDPAEADVVVVNTCGFLASARDESVKTLQNVAAMKDRGLKGLFVTGCMVGQYRDVIIGAVPEVDRLIDFNDYRRLPEIIDQVVPPESAPKSLLVRPGRNVQARLTPAHFAYLKISEGCNHTCTFCVIPKIRGPMRSVPFEEVLQRARRLVDVGARELNVVAQDSTMYGADLYGRYRLAELLEALAEIPNLRWIRLLYAYPTEVDDALVATLSRGGKILPYIDVPLQHVADPVLSAMKRRSTNASTRALLTRLRKEVPGIAVRTTFIVGFPGETEADFDALLEFIEEHPIDRLGAFTYSPEPGSPAHDLADAVPEEVRQERLDRLMRRQHELSTARRMSEVGRRTTVLIEDPGEESGTAIGRGIADAPEIDGKVYVRGGRFKAGDMPKVKVERTDAYDTWAVAEGTAK